MLRLAQVALLLATFAVGSDAKVFYWFKATRNWQKSRGKELGREEYTMKGWVKVDTGVSRDLGCLTCNSHNHCSMTGNWASSGTQSTSGALQLRTHMDAWEDDNGGRCSFKKGFWINDDDSRCRKECSINMKSYAMGTTHTHRCSGGNAWLEVQFRWWPDTTSAPDTLAPPTSAPATVAPPTSAPPTSAPATSAPATSAPPTSAPPTSAPATSAPDTSAPPTPAPTPLCTDGTGWTDSHGHMCAFYILSAVRDALYNETLGGIFSTWTGDDPCVWGGVECYDGEFVFRLKLGNAETLAAVVPDLSRLTRMVELNVRGTQITGFAGLPASLLDLDFSFTQINGPMPAAATTAKRAVTARSAGLTGELPDFQDGMREIDVSFNSMEGPFPSLPADLINFIAQSNKFTGPLPECESCMRVIVNTNELTGSLRAYPNLWTGHFQYNFLSGGLDLTLMPTATYIDVTHNMLTGTVTDLQDAGLKIQTLKLGHNQFSGSFPFAPVSPARVLHRLELNHNQLTGAEPTAAETALVAAQVTHNDNTFGMRN